MGNANSSALRADDQATPASVSQDGHEDVGPGFGSLATLGGPKKFKKKPVLVLDPEELARAHMMFQEASAELLGEEAPRPERGAAVLGLAPIDDETATPEDMGASDDAEAGADDDAIPSAEEVLRMTESRAPVDAEADPFADEYLAQQLEDLDVDHRIFPSLPLRSEEEIAAEEEAEATRNRETADEEAGEGTAEAAEAEDTDAFTPPPHIDYIPDGEPEDLYVSPFAVEQFEQDDAHSEDGKAESGAAPAFPVDPLPETESAEEADALADTDVEAEMDAESESVPESAMASLQDAFGSKPFLDFPSEPVRFAAEEEVAPAPAEEPQPEEASEEAPAPAEGDGDTAAEERFELHPLPRPEVQAADEFDVEADDDAEPDYAPEPPFDTAEHSPSEVDYDEQTESLPEPEYEAEMDDGAQPEVAPEVEDAEAEDWLEAQFAGEAEPLDEHAPETEPEAQSEPDAADEDALELSFEDEWHEDAPLGLGLTPEPEPEPEPAAMLDEPEAEPEGEADGDYTEIDDQPTDGYAFMYASNPRARTLHALAEGQSNSLRARLLKERKDAMDELGLEEQTESLWARFVAWLRNQLVT